MNWDKNSITTKNPYKNNQQMAGPTMGRQNQPPASPYPPENIPRRNTPGSIPLPQAIKPLTKTQVSHLGPESKHFIKKHHETQVMAY